MKKLLSLILVLFLAAALFIAYQWRQAADRLSLAARGGIYRNLGLKLELAPASDGVKGLSRLKPYVEIPQVVFDLSGWGLGGPVPLGSARLSTSLWQSSDLLLVFDAGSVNRSDLETKRLAFELAVPDRILGARAESLTFSHPAAQEKLVLKEPWLQIGFQEGVIPERANFRIDAIDYTKDGAEAPVERLHFGVLETSYQSERRGSSRHWKFLHNSEGGSFEFPKAHGGIQPWSYRSEGSFAEIPLERWKSLATDWKSLTESQPSLAPPWADLGSWSARIVAFVTELRPQIDSLEMRWGGMSLQGMDKTQAVSVSPMDFQLKYEDAAGGLKAKAKGGMKGMQLQWGDQHFEFSNLDFSQDSSYAGVSYQDWLKYFLRYYSASFAMQKAPERVLEAFETLYRAYFAQMPDVAKGEFHLERLKYENPRYRTEQRGAAMTVVVDPKGWNLSLKDDFDSVPAGDEAKSIVGGHLDLNFGFHLPWAELLRSVRGEAPTAESAPSLLGVFAGRPAGVDWKWLIDLGPNLFAVRLNLALDADAGKIVAKTPVVLNGASSKVEEREYALALLKSFLSEGKLEFQVQVDRLSHLQAAMEKIKSGSSMGLGLVGAYVVIDTKEDSMKFRVDLHSGKILLNGKENEGVESLMRQTFSLENKNYLPK